MQGTFAYPFGAFEYGYTTDFYSLALNNVTDTVTIAKLPYRGSRPTLDYHISSDGKNRTTTITNLPGCEYSFDGGAHWGSANEQTFGAERPLNLITIRYNAGVTFITSQR